MKASKLIEKLQKIIELEGDLEVKIFNEYPLDNYTYPQFSDVFEDCMPVVEEKEEYQDNFLACECEFCKESYEKAPTKFITIK